MLNYPCEGSMLASENGPYYDLEEIRSMIESEAYLTSRRVRSHLINQGFDPSETAEDVFQAITPSHFYKSDELKNRPGVFADIYRHVECYEIEWYAKFFVDDDGCPQVNIWSLKEDGYQF